MRKLAVRLWTMLWVLPAVAAWGQNITVNGRLSPAQTLAGPNYAIGANLGQQVGGNLFHSFGAFRLNRGETATFNGPASVANVIGRVTGGAQSSIDGAVRSTMQGANLFLINPARVVFGPNARVDVSGSFNASSADYLRLQDGARFQATNPDASTLTSAPPSTFGFLTPTPRPVTVNRTTLGTKAGSTLGLVGGPVTISGGVLQAPAGTVHVTSAAGAGEVAVDPRGGPTPTVTSFGPVRVERGARIAVSNPAGLGSGSSVFIRAGTLDIAASEIGADNHGSGPGGVASLHGKGAVTISSGADVHALARASGRGADVSIGTGVGGTVVVDAARIAMGSLASGEGGALSINTGTLALRNGAVVLSTAQNRGNSRPIGIAADSVLLDGTGTLLFSETTGAGLADAAGAPVQAGAGGQISLVSGRLTVQNNALIGATTVGSGAGGAIEFPRADTLVLAAGGQILSETSGPGPGGDISVNLSGNLTIAGTTGSPGLTGITAKTAGTELDAGPAGHISVQAGTLHLAGDQGQISNGTRESGNAGRIEVTVRGDLTIDGTGSTNLPTAIISSAEANSSGNAGTVRVNAGSLAIRNAGGISTDTFGPGRGGDVVVQAGSISLQDRGAISSSTSGSGQGGNVSVTAGSDILLTGLGPQVTAASTGTRSVGNAGSITVSAPRLSLRDGASISTEAQAAEGGDIIIGPGDLLHLQSSSITTSVKEAFGVGSSGGNIAVDTRFVVLDQSQISANAVVCRGGNIRIQADQFVPSADSAITATSERSLPGTIAISGPPLNLNGSLVVLASTLRAAAVLLREGCAGQGAVPRSSLVLGGRGGLRHDPKVTLPALYFARRLIPAGPEENAKAKPPEQVSVSLATRCG